MPWAISAAGPIFSGSSSYSTAACVTSSSGQLSSSRLFIVRHQRPGRMVNSRLYLSTSPRPDKILTMELLVSDLLCARTNRRLALAVSSSIPSIFFIHLVSTSILGPAAIMANIQIQS